MSAYTCGILGNICRSPIAEAVFVDSITKAGVQDRWEVDSAAIGGWHIGRNPDPRAMGIMSKYNLAYTNKARQIRKDDFKHYDYIFGMDDENISDLKDLAPRDATAKILLLGDYDPQGDRIIRDPYYVSIETFGDESFGNRLKFQDKGSEGFERCYVQCLRCCDNFLKKIAAHEGKELGF